MMSEGDTESGIKKAQSEAVFKRLQKESAAKDLQQRVRSWA